MYYFKTLILASFLVSGYISGAELKRNPRITADHKVQPVVTVTDEERRATYLAAGRVLKHVDQARDAIAADSGDEAVHPIRQAILLTDIIQQSLPTYDVNARIKAGDMVYEDQESIKATVVPIFEELERKKLLAPVVCERY